MEILAMVNMIDPIVVSFSISIRLSLKKQFHYFYLKNDKSCKSTHMAANFCQIILYFVVKCLQDFAAMHYQCQYLNIHQYITHLIYHNIYSVQGGVTNSQE